MEEKIINLNFPVDVYGETIKSLTLRRNTVKDHMLAYESGDLDFDTDEMLIANLAEQPLDVIDALDWSDYQQCLVEVTDSLQRAKSFDPNKDGVVILDFPINGLTEITMRRATVKDRKQAVKKTDTTIEEQLLLVQILTNQDKSFIESMEWGDFNKCLLQLDFFCSTPVKI